MMVSLASGNRSFALVPWPFNRVPSCMEPLGGETLMSLITSYPADLAWQLMGCSAMESQLLPALRQIQRLGSAQAIEWSTLCGIPGRFAICSS